MADRVVGIDLGTTNSSIGYVASGRPTLIEIDGSPLMPSAVGLAPDGTLLVGRAARNQRHLYPERTVTSIKRKMGGSAKVRLGEEEYTPVELSAMILRRLKQAGEAALGEPLRRAVITVPAFFTDAQRTATREAGEIAGFTVERILNEPTAAALCYLHSEAEPRTLLVYDLGGGTFDVSIVRSHGDVTEVLASHGDTALGGDDFDAIVRARFGRALNADGVEDTDPRVDARLFRAAEEAKIKLSSETLVRVSEEHLAVKGGLPYHLTTEVDRSEYEELIADLLERTRDSVHTALKEARVLAREIDEVVLVGGATRTPRVAQMLHDILGLAPRQEIDPDQAVALGAAIQAARIGGQATSRILIDVSPYSFGTSYLGLLDGRPSDDCYMIVLRRNQPLPTRQSQLFYTMAPGQPATEVEVFQGEDPVASRNQRLGEFRVEGLDARAPQNSPLVFEFSLDVDGILRVEVTERHTGLKKAITITDAFRTLSDAELEEARTRIAGALGGDSPIEVLAEPIPEPPPDLDSAGRKAWVSATSLIEKAERLLPGLDAADYAEVDQLRNALRGALRAGDHEDAKAQAAALSDVLFYLG